MELRRQGLSLAAIAAELGIGRNTLARHYASEVGSQSMLRVTLANGECQQHGSPMPCGRPTHKPTAETRAHVRRLVAESVKVAAIARALGIAPQTLAKHYPQELRPIG